MWPWNRAGDEPAKNRMSKTQQHDLEVAIGHRFKDKQLVLMALSHPSRNAEKATLTYERLAWVGDAFLYHTISSYLYEAYPDSSTSELHELRERYKKNLDLAKMDGEGLRLSRFLITGKSRDGQEHSSGMVATMVEAVIGAISLESRKDAQKFIEINIIKKKV
jgi:ribonuclease III